MRTNPRIGNQLNALMMENLARFFMHLQNCGNHWIERLVACEHGRKRE